MTTAAILEPFHVTQARKARSALVDAQLALDEMCVHSRALPRELSTKCQDLRLELHRCLQGTFDPNLRLTMPR